MKVIEIITATALTKMDGATLHCLIGVPSLLRKNKRARQTRYQWVVGKNHLVPGTTIEAEVWNSMSYSESEAMEEAYKLKEHVKSIIDTQAEEVF